MTQKNLIRERNTLLTDEYQILYLAEQSKSSRKIRNDEWFKNQPEKFVSIGIFYKSKCAKG